MDEILRVIQDFALNVVLAYLLPTGFVGVILKVQRRRRVYSKGTEGEKQLVRDCNVGLLGLNGLFLLWSFVNFPGLLVVLLRTGAVSFALVFYRNRPLSVIAVPDSMIALLRWIADIMDGFLELIPQYHGLRVRVFASNVARETRHHAFSGPQIGKLADGQQLLLSQTHFICHSCGLERDNTHLGDVLLGENKQTSYFCDETPCRMEARNLHTKMFTMWKRKSAGVS